MKTLKLLLTAAVAVLTFSSAASALPPGKEDGSEATAKEYGTELATKAQFTELKAGDKVTLVCKMHGPQKEITVKDSKMAMELCEENHMAHCDTCKKDYKVTWLNPSGKSGGPTTAMNIVDENGKPCMMYTKAM